MERRKQRKMRGRKWEWEGGEGIEKGISKDGNSREEERKRKKRRGRLKGRKRRKGGEVGDRKRRGR